MDFELTKAPCPSGPPLVSCSLTGEGGRDDIVVFVLGRCIVQAMNEMK